VIIRKLVISLHDYKSLIKINKSFYTVIIIKRYNTLTVKEKFNIYKLTLIHLCPIHTYDIYTVAHSSF